MGLATAIGLGAMAIGSAVSSSSNRSAANRAAQASEENNAANVALQRDIYNQNRTIMQPFVNRGNTAGNAINALLGLGGTAQNSPQPTQVQPNALSQFSGGVSPQNYYGVGDGFSGFNPSMANSLGIVNDLAVMPNGSTGSRGVANIPSIMSPGAQAGTTSAPAGQTAQQDYNSAFNNFLNSTAYQFTFGEGMDALNSGFAGSGLLQSGARDRAAIDYGQNAALGSAFMPYMSLLGQQQAVGAGSASSLAGVGQNFASNVAQMNTINANNQANAAIARGQNNVFGNMLGTIGGGLFGYGMG